MGRFLAIVFVLACSIACGDGSNDPGDRVSPDASVPRADAAPPPLPVSIAVIGDTQRTLPGEVLLGREVNDDERPVIIDHLATVNVSAFVHVGDLVARGSSEGDWEEFDQLFAPIASSGKPVYPVLGNHEYCRNEVSCARRDLFHDMDLSPVFERFPAMGGERWYAQQVGGLGLIFLDTNFWEYGVDPLDPASTLADYQPQIDWFRDQVAMFEQDASVTNVVVAGHHPMFTNAEFVYENNPLVAVDESEDLAFLRATFLQTMEESSKISTYVSGHAHGFEHFRQGGIDFLVTGGGGGPRTSYLSGSEAVYPDLFSQAGEFRPFNFLLVRLEAGALTVEVFGLEKGEPTVELIYEL